MSKRRWFASRQYMTEDVQSQQWQRLSKVNVTVREQVSNHFCRNDNGWTSQYDSGWTKLTMTEIGRCYRDRGKTSRQYMTEDVQSQQWQRLSKVNVTVREQVSNHFCRNDNGWTSQYDSGWTKLTMTEIGRCYRDRGKTSRQDIIKISV